MTSIRGTGTIAAGLPDFPASARKQRTCSVIRARASLRSTWVPTSLLDSGPCIALLESRYNCIN
eukprot:355906-Chlamydomonas_euryale.AAC.2